MRFFAVAVILGVVLCVCLGQAKGRAYPYHDSQYKEDCLTKKFTQTAITVGKAIPHESLHFHTYWDSLVHESMTSALANRRVLLLGIPFGSETEARSQILGYLKARRVLIQSLGISRVHVVISGNVYEAHALTDSEILSGEPTSQVMSIWADSDHRIAQTLGLAYDARPDGLGIVSARYALLVDDADVVYAAVEDPHSIDITRHEKVFKAIADLIDSNQIPASLDSPVHDEL